MKTLATRQFTRLMVLILFQTSMILAQATVEYETMSDYQAAVRADILEVRKSQKRTLRNSAIGFTCTALLHLAANATYNEYQTTRDPSEVDVLWDRTQTLDKGVKIGLGFSSVALFPLLFKQNDVKDLKQNLRHIPGIIEQVYSTELPFAVLYANQIGGNNLILTKSTANLDTDNQRASLDLLLFNMDWKVTGSIDIMIPDLNTVEYISESRNQWLMSVKTIEKGRIHSKFLSVDSTGTITSEFSAPLGTQHMIPLGSSENTTLLCLGEGDIQTQIFTLNPDGNLNDSQTIDGIPALTQVQFSRDLEGSTIAGVTKHSNGHDSNHISILYITHAGVLRSRETVAISHGKIDLKMLRKREDGSIILWYSSFSPPSDFTEHLSYHSPAGEQLKTTVIPNAKDLKPIALFGSSESYMVLGNRLEKLFFAYEDPILGNLAIPYSQAKEMEAVGLFRGLDGKHNILFSRSSDAEMQELLVFTMPAFK